MAAVFRVQVVAGPHTGESRLIPTGGGALIVGRGHTVGLDLEQDGGCSRRHCTLAANGTDVLLKDEGSTNGTFVGGQRITTLRLTVGARIELGHCTILEIVTPAATPALPLRRWREIEAGSYEELGELKPGATSEPLLARRADGQLVVLKRLSARADAERRERFLAEAAFLEHLGSHPRIVPMVEYGRYQNRHTLVLHYVHVRVLQGPPCESFAWPEVLQIAVDVVGAVRHAHSRNVLHRDVKPDNILITDGEKDIEAWLTDFGMGRVRDLAEYQQAWDRAHRTREGTRLGSPCTMSPRIVERWKNDQPPFRDDTELFALGASLYWYLTGSWPVHFSRRDPTRPVDVRREEMFAEIRWDNITPLRQRIRRTRHPSIEESPPLGDLVHLIDDVLSPEPQVRTAAELHQRLRGIPRVPPRE